MGVAKAALEASVRYLAADLGPDGVRVNAISAGPIRTLAPRASPGSRRCTAGSRRSRRCAPTSPPKTSGRSAVYLCSDLSSAVTGETLYVDGGFSIMGVPTGD